MNCGKLSPGTPQPKYCRETENRIGRPLPRKVADYPPLSPVAAGLRCACPRCGVGKLYDGVLAPAENCVACGLEYAFIDSGDGPAVLVILLLGFFFLGLALFVEATFEPPIWVHVVLWLSLITLSALWALRVTKAIMIALQYKTKARQGRLA